MPRGPIECSSLSFPLVSFSFLWFQVRGEDSGGCTSRLELAGYLSAPPLLFSLLSACLVWEKAIATHLFPSIFPQDHLLAPGSSPRCVGFPFVASKDCSHCGASLVLGLRRHHSLFPVTLASASRLLWFGKGATAFIFDYSSTGKRPWRRALSKYLVRIVF